MGAYFPQADFPGVISLTGVSREFRFPPRERRDAGALFEKWIRAIAVKELPSAFMLRLPLVSSMA